MKNTICLILMLLVLILSAPNVFAEIGFSNALAKDIAQAYGFYLGQIYSLGEISKKYPSISGLAKIAKLEFWATFESSIEGMDTLMAKHVQCEWKEVKKQLASQIKNHINIEQISETQARQFVELVRERAKGAIESPVIETLLLFKSGYENNPEREFLDGYKFKYSINGSGKAKGVAFSIESPKTWVAKEGNRPNIVQKFVSENGRGHELLLILIKELPLQPGEKITEQVVLDILNPKNIQDYIPDDATYLNGGAITLENLPGLWVHFRMDMSRVRNTFGMEAISYILLYKNKMIQIQGKVITSINGKSTGRGGFAKYEELFDLMVNSFVIFNMYK
ncbi:hypothetical protein [Dethiosulfatarculus sandiegensis]|nr:hypothetical protein [Dethiosulfatarculus sandiegensis]